MPHSVQPGHARLGGSFCASSRDVDATAPVSIGYAICDDHGARFQSRADITPTTLMGFGVQDAGKKKTEDTCSSLQEEREEGEWGDRVGERRSRSKRDGVGGIRRDGP
eukprot:492724-Rhodomonas_salina.1